jgi:hypothetical protein
MQIDGEIYAERKILPITLDFIYIPDGFRDDLTVVYLRTGNILNVYKTVLKSTHSWQVFRFRSNIYRIN